MKNLFRTLIPYKWTALLVLMLMAGQAFCEMNLPQYTQALIDTGIQNRGIEHIVPEAVTRREFEAAAALMDEEERAAWEAAFEDGGEIYTRKDLSREELDELDELLLDPIVSRYAQVKCIEDIEKALEDAGKTDTTVNILDEKQSK